MRVLQDKYNRGVGIPRVAVSSPRERGIALMVVLGFIFILGMLAWGFAVNMKVEGVLARKAGAQSEVEWLCRSGVELSKYILSQQMANAQEPYDSLNQSWAGGPGSTNGFNVFLDRENLNLTKSAWAPNSILGQIFPDETEFEEKIGKDTRCAIQIVDLERKYNINRAAEDGVGRFPLEMAFELMGVDVSSIPYLVDAIKDWRDEDDVERVNGVESKHYEPEGYVSKNGPIDDLKELLLIEGITPKMFWGNATNQLAATMMTSTTREEEDEEADYPYGLVDLFTPISVGYININTASMEVLQLLPGMDQNKVSFIMDERVGTDGIDGTWDDTPFTNIRELSTRNIPGFQSREAAANAGRFLSVRSATFEVTVTAQMRGMQRTLVAVLSRKDPKDIKILYTYWK